MIGANAQKKSLILLMSAVTTASTGSSIDNYNSLIWQENLSKVEERMRKTCLFSVKYSKRQNIGKTVIYVNTEWLSLLL